MMRASVVIPAYNAARCIERAIGSVLAQSEPGFEVLVVDDVSTDATAPIVAEMAARDPRIRLLRAARNGGPGLARNQGIAAARGEWIALLDADDAFHPDRLERLLAVAARQDCDMVADNLLLHVAGQAPRPMFSAAQLPHPLRLDARAFVEGNLHRPGERRLGFGYLKPLIRRSFLSASGIGYNAARFSEDYLFYLRCLLHGARWVVAPEASYDYTVDPNSLTAAHTARDLRDLAEAERSLLGHPAVRADPALRSSILRHVRAVERALSWFSFATALKRRDARAALASLDRNPRNILHIGREGFRALPRALARAGAKRRVRVAG